MEQKICAPNIKYDGVSCYTKDVLVEIAKAYNNVHNKNKINLDDTQTKKELVSKLNKNIKDCPHETCWLKYLYNYKIDNKELEHTFFKPKDNNDDLTTDLLNDVMAQYEKKYKNFIFLNALPSDSYKTSVAKLFEMKNGYMKKDYVGIIFNNKPHTHQGEHWVAVFIDNLTKTIEYYDSLGKSLPQDIKKFLDKHFKNYSIRTYNYKHQKGGNECGIYSLEFITKRLDKKNIGKEMKINRKKFLR